MKDFDWDQPHPEFWRRSESYKSTKMQFEIAEKSLQAVCYHKFPENGTSYKQCTVCGYLDREGKTRKDLENEAKALYAQFQAYIQDRYK